MGVWPWAAGFPASTQSSAQRLSVRICVPNLHRRVQVRTRSEIKLMVTAMSAATSGPVLEREGLTSTLWFSPT